MDVFWMSITYLILEEWWVGIYKKRTSVHPYINVTYSTF